MEITSKPVDGAHVIVLNGDVDASSALRLDYAVSQALSADKGNILIDCTNLTYISSAGLGVFISHLKEIEDENRKIILFGVNEQVLGVFHILGLDDLLLLADTEEDALRSSALDKV